MEWGGTPYPVADLGTGRIPAGISYSIVDEGVLLAGPVDDLDYFTNHSCDPNIWFDGGRSLRGGSSFGPPSIVVGGGCGHDCARKHVIKAK